MNIRLVIATALAFASLASHAETCKVHPAWASGPYEGECRNGIAHGKGTVTGDGITVTGNFVDGLIEGPAEMRSATGAVVITHYKDGKRHGPSITRLPDGSTLEMQYENSRVLAPIVIQHSNGMRTIAEGMSPDGKLHGKAAMLLPSGEKADFTYDNGKMVEPVFLTLKSGLRLRVEGKAASIAPPEDIIYASARQKLPTVLVIDGSEGKLQARMAQEISSGLAANQAEEELKRAGFDVVERSKLSEMLPSLKAGFLAGDAGTGAALKIGKLKDVRYIVMIDVESATLVAATPEVKKSLTGMQRSENRSRSDTIFAVLSVIAESTGEIEKAEAWRVRMQWRIVDRTTARVVKQGTVEDAILTSKKISRVLGSETVSPYTVTGTDMSRRVVQLAVAQIQREL